MITANLCGALQAGSPPVNATDPHVSSEVGWPWPTAMCPPSHSLTHPPQTGQEDKIR